MQWYKTGTVGVTSGSTAVMGTGTLWSLNAKPGDAFTIDGTKIYEIASLDVTTPNTKLYLTNAYSGATVVSGQAYSIVNLSTVSISTATLANQVSALLNSWQGREDEFRIWQAGIATGGYNISGTPASDSTAGYYPMTDPLGVTSYVACPAKVAALTNTTGLGITINAATAKATPIDADMLPLMDSAGSNVVKKLSWVNVKLSMKAYMDTLYPPITSPTLVTPSLGVASATSLAVAGFVGSSATAAINIPTGTTAQRPTPANGMIRMNSDYGRPEYYSSLLSMWLPFSGGGATPNIGDPFGGGFFAGYISAAGNGIASHMLVVAPKAAGESVLAWDTTAGGSATGFTSVIDGPTNSAGLAALGTRYAAATWCEGLSIGGYTDWYLPAKNELEVAYHNLKNVSQDNYAPGSYGSNPNAVPPLEPVSTPYTATRPAQTTVAAFKVGNSESFADYGFWSSTEYSDPYAWFQHFYSGLPGFQDVDTKTNGLCVRAFRRLLI